MSKQIEKRIEKIEERWEIFLQVFAVLLLITSVSGGVSLTWFAITLEWWGWDILGRIVSFCLGLAVMLVPMYLVREKK